MRIIKHLEECPAQDGSIIYKFRPTVAMKRDIDAKYGSFKSRTDGQRHVDWIVDLHNTYKRKANKKIHIQKGSVLALVAAYKKSHHWTALKPNSKKSYNQMLKSVLLVSFTGESTCLGDMDAQSMTAVHGEELYNFLYLNVSHSRANSAIRVLRKIWNVGSRTGKPRLVTINPFSKMSIKGTKTRTVMWEEEDVLQFVDMADQMGLPSIGTLYLLCYDLCQRPGDMRQLTWDNYNQCRFTGTDIFSFTQEKTGTYLEIEASPRLVERMKNVKRSEFLFSKMKSADGTRKVKGPTDHNMICWYEHTGAKYDNRHYNTVAQRVRNAAGLPFQFRASDMRRSGATIMAESECTNAEIRSVTGHKSMDVLSIYVRHTRKTASSAVNKRFNK